MKSFKRLSAYVICDHNTIRKIAYPSQLFLSAFGVDLQFFDPDASKLPRAENNLEVHRHILKSDVVFYIAPQIRTEPSEMENEKGFALDNDKPTMVIFDPVIELETFEAKPSVDFFRDTKLSPLAVKQAISTQLALMVGCFLNRA